MLFPLMMKNLKEQITQNKNKQTSKKKNQVVKLVKYGQLRTREKIYYKIKMKNKKIRKESLCFISLIYSSWFENLMKLQSSK